jgi:3-methyladenine DNA glycosylase/8-oxoguanine DNA glycosylase
MTVLSISSVGPHDFELSLRIARSFSPGQFQDFSLLRSPVRIQDNPTVLELRQVHRDPPTLEIRTNLRGSASEVKRIARWIIFADLDLGPFYRIAASHSVLGPITQELHGLKPMRPASLFEMLVIAITEQQISMAAAYRIRTRIIERFGDHVNGLWAFPTPKRLSESSVTDLLTCGLSRRKAEYVKGLASKVTNGLLDLDRLEAMADEDVRSLLLQVRGLGPWSAEYFLVRGLSRPDRVPADDLGIRSIVGRYLGSGQRLSPQGTMRKLSSFKPYRGLAAFYLLAYDRLSK